MRAPVVRELLAGVSVIDVGAPFAPGRRQLRDAAAHVSAAPFVVRTHADPWQSVVSCLPGPRHPAAPEGVAVLGFLTRVDCELLSGNAWIARADDAGTSVAPGPLAP